MSKFAKLFDLEDGSQVVFMIHDVSDDEDKNIEAKIIAITEYESVTSEMSFNYTHAMEARDMFEDEFNYKKAKEFRQIIVQLFNQDT